MKISHTHTQHIDALLSYISPPRRIFAQRNEKILITFALIIFFALIIKTKVLYKRFSIPFLITTVGR